MPIHRWDEIQKYMPGGIKYKNICIYIDGIKYKNKFLHIGGIK